MKKIIDEILEKFYSIGAEKVSGIKAARIIEEIIATPLMSNEVEQAMKYIIRCHSDLGFMGSPEYDRARKIVDNYNKVVEEKNEKELYLKLAKKYGK